MRNYIIVLFLGVLIGSGLVYKLRPAQIETKVVVQEKQVIKREIVRKDGTVIKEEITKDSVKQTNKVVPKLALNKVIIGLNQERVYNFEYQRRIAGPWFIGASVNSERVLGINLGLEF